MQIAKITSKGQVTIPASVRHQFQLQTGDLLSFEVEGGCIITRKIRPQTDDYLDAVPATLGEWLSDELVRYA
jgi:antitoxin PrlF